MSLIAADLFGDVPPLKRRNLARNGARSHCGEPGHAGRGAAHARSRRHLGHGRHRDGGLVASASAKTAAAFLAAAVIATGIRSPLPQLLNAGPRPLMVIVVSTLVAFGLSLAAALVAMR